MMRDGQINMFSRYFLMELWGRMRYAPTLTYEKGACFFFRRRSGKGWLGGGGLLLSIDIVWKGIRGLGDVGRDRK